MLAYFNPHLPCGRWQKTLSDNDLSDYFNPHLPCGRWRCHSFLFHALRNFNPHLPCGRWLRLSYLLRLIILFQSTPSLRKVTKEFFHVSLDEIISIHTFLAEGDLRLVCSSNKFSISIHTFLTEGDVVSVRCAGAMVISIHTFLTEGDAILPSWPDKHIHFNPHLPCRRWQQQQLTMCMIFLFQSTPSLQKVTEAGCRCGELYRISIHTFLAEGDLSSISCFRIPSYFNPHLPRGRWPSKSATI